MIKRSLAFRLNLAILVIVGVMSLLLGSLSSFYLYRKALENVRLDAEQTVTVAQLSLVDRLWDLDNDGVKDIASALLLDDKFALISITDKTGEINQTLHSPQYDQASKDAFDSTDFFKLSRVIYKDNDVIGSLEILISKAPAQERALETASLVVLSSILLIFLLTGTMALATDRLIKKPIQKLREETREVSTGNLLSTIDLSRDDELGVLARDFAKMRDSIRDKIAIIEMQNHTLEDKVKERTAQLERKHNETLAVFKSLKEGILTFSNPRRIDPDFSPYVTTIFETDTVAFQPLDELLFAHAAGNRDQSYQLMAALDAIIGSDAITFDMNGALLIQEITIQLQGRRKILDLSWSPVIATDNTIEKMVLTIRDVTEVQAIREVSRSNQKNVRILQELIDCQASAFSLFFSSFQERLEAIRSQLENADPLSLKQALISLHTMKGNARTYGFSALSSKIHELESVLNDEGSDYGLINDHQRVLHLLTELESIFEQYQLVRIKIFRAAQSESQTRFEQLLQCITKAAQSGDLATLRDLSSRLKDLMSSADLGSALETIGLASLPTIARDCGKPAPFLKVIGHAPTLKSDAMTALNDVLVHLFRNSLDHGLEAIQIRQQRGKLTRGTITIEIEEKARQVEISYQDDGQGIDLSYARELMVSRGLLGPHQSLSKEALIGAMFTEGFSTARHLTEISGRGIGMSAMRHIIEQQGGSFQCEVLAESLLDIGFAPLRFTMVLPLDLRQTREAS